jgi:hypothetical protein
MQIPDDIRNGVVFLYSAGTAGRRPIGTGFFVSIPTSDTSPPARRAYMVTAKHIVEGVYRAGETLYARVNGRGTDRTGGVGRGGVRASAT